MLKNKTWLWGAVRSLRGKKDKGLDRSQDDSDPGSAEDEELEESELKRRVKQWQAQSFLPEGDSLPSASSTTDQNRDNNLEANQHRVNRAMVDAEKSDVGGLFHPDFADWASIHHDQTYAGMKLLPAKSGPDDLLQVLDDATASLSKLLAAPFG